MSMDTLSTQDQSGQLYKAYCVFNTIYKYSINRINRYDLLLILWYRYIYAALLSRDVVPLLSSLAAESRDFNDERVIYSEMSDGHIAVRIQSHMPHCIFRWLLIADVTCCILSALFWPLSLSLYWDSVWSCANLVALALTSIHGNRLDRCAAPLPVTLSDLIFTVVRPRSHDDISNQLSSRERCWAPSRYT